MVGDDLTGREFVDGVRASIDQFLAAGWALKVVAALVGIIGVVNEATVFRRHHIGFVFQFFNLLPMMSARDNVALPLLAACVPSREVERRTSEMLDVVGMSQRAAHRPDEMSGGEQQRVAIARALVMRPKLLLADEPTGNLDTASGREILDVLDDAVRAYHLAIVMVTHSDAAAARASRVLILREGAIDAPDEDRCDV